VCPNITKAKVLVVEDDDATRDAIMRLVKAAGLEVETFSSSEEFLGKPLMHDAPTCLILDLRLRALSGLDLQQRLMRDGVELPVIFLTGFGDISTAVDALRWGAFDFLEKPLREGVLLDRIAKALDHDAQQFLADDEFSSAQEKLPPDA
jgi:FixJ family two-component response regulator